MSTRNNILRMGILLPLFLMVTATVYLVAAFDIRTQFTGSGEMSPRSVPILSAVLMYLAAGWVLLGEFRNPGPNEPHADIFRPALITISIAGYILLFKPLGYTIATMLFVSALFITFKYELRRPFIFLSTAVVVTAMFYVLFAVIFGVRLPSLTGWVI